MFYYILIGIVIICSPLYKDWNISLVSKYEQTENQRYSYFYVISLVLMAISGLRSNAVGIDTIMYEELFNYSKLLTLKEDLASTIMEHGYVIFEHIIGSVFGNYQWFLIIIAIITIIPVTIIIYKYSAKPWMSYFLFITFAYFPFFMTAIRQSIAIGITLIAFLFVKKKKLILFLLSIGLASTFHITSIIFLPVYWIDKFKLNQKNITGAVMCIIGGFVFKQPLFQFLNKYARQSYGNLEAGGQRMYIFMLLSIILGCIYYKNLKEQNENNKTFFYMIIVSAVIWPIMSVNPALARLYYYYSIYSIIYIPNLIVSIKDKGVKLIVTGGYLLVGGYYLIMQVILSSNNYYPYYFFWK
jgi:hypothetical protein